MEGAPAVRESDEPALAPTAPASAEERLAAVTALGWLAPDAASLAALCRPLGPHTWETLRFDPGAVLLVLRSGTEHSSSTPALDQPAIPEAALQHLHAPPAGFVDWDKPAVAAVYRAALAVAQNAALLAKDLDELLDPRIVWAAGLLAPLGWMAACAVDPAAASACTAAAASESVETQHQFWSAEATDLGRRLARRWALPQWLTTVLTRLDLPAERTPGGDNRLLALVQLAAAQAAEQGFDLRLVSREAAESAARALGCRLPLGLPEPSPPPARRWRNPYREPLLRDLLAVAAENRRLRDGTLHRQLELDADALHQALRQQCGSEADRLEESKLSALAELSAGAGHEINNPLAVISGQAQYLLGHGEDWFAPDIEADARRALTTIITQTKRIHAVLRDLMQFARPAPARPDWFDLPILLGEVAAGLRELAEQRRVRLEVEAPQRWRVCGDVEQVRLGLACLLRNAVEAAPPDGWARLRLCPGVVQGMIETHVEDSGPGPDEGQVPHLFDPFYSGRSAGRGRGLGLPIAWRAARQQGGGVRLERRRPGQPTCFVFSLPACLDESPSRMASAPLTISCTSAVVNGVH
jgi:signal transduction histidine kinase